MNGIKHINILFIFFIFLTSCTQYEYEIEDIKDSFTQSNCFQSQTVSSFCDLDRSIIHKKWAKKFHDKLLENFLNDQANLKENISEISEILIEIDENEKFEIKLKEIKNYINSNNFKSAATKYSISNSASVGGNIGWVKETVLSNKIVNKLDKLNIDGITKPIKYPNGFLILMINDKKEIKQRFNLDKELEESIIFEKNKQLNQYSLLYYKKLKQNTIINEK